MLDAIAKLPVTGDKTALKTVLTALTTGDGSDFTAHGRRGVEQLYFALDRLTLAYRDGAAIPAADFKPVRDSMKSVRDMKLFDARNATADIAPAKAAMAATVKDLSTKIAALK